jgi:hypothetical protein
MRRPSGRRVAWLLTRSSSELSIVEKAMIEKLLAACPEIAAGRKLAVQFMEMVRKRQADALDPWMAETSACTSPKDLQGFARGLEAEAQVDFGFAEVDLAGDPPRPSPSRRRRRVAGGRCSDSSPNW